MKVITINESSAFIPTGYWLLATGYWLLATGYWLLPYGWLYWKGWVDCEWYLYLYQPCYILALTNLPISHLRN